MSHRYIDIFFEGLWGLEPIWLGLIIYLILGFITANVVVYRMVQVEKAKEDNYIWQTTVLATFVWVLWPLFIGITIYGIIKAYKTQT